VKDIGHGTVGDFGHVRDTFFDPQANHFSGENAS
jgi:hypothetical protein